MNIAVLLGGGKGTRFGENKLLVSLLGMPLYRHSLLSFLQHPEIDALVLVASPEMLPLFLQEKQEYSKIQEVLLGGDTRFESTKKAYYSLSLQEEDVLVFHNCANPFVSFEEITSVLALAKASGASGVARKVTSTLRHEETGVIFREKVWEMETPQALTKKVFQKGLECQKKSLCIPTDDLALAELAGISPVLLSASAKNRKITTRDDLSLFSSLRSFRTGIGQDSHMFSSKKGLYLGGVLIENAPKLLANSDGDVALHALANALSSALGEGSFSLFADTMCKKGICNSQEYIRVLLEKIEKASGKIENITLSFEAKTPKLEPYFPKMKKHIAKLCSLSENQIGCTATTGEGLTECGKGKGISVFASATLSFSL